MFEHTQMTNSEPIPTSPGCSRDLKAHYDLNISSRGSLSCKKNKKYTPHLNVARSRHKVDGEQKIVKRDNPELGVEIKTEPQLFGTPSRAINSTAVSSDLISRASVQQEKKPCHRVYTKGRQSQHNAMPYTTRHPLKLPYGLQARDIQPHLLEYIEEETPGKHIEVKHEEETEEIYCAEPTTKDTYQKEEEIKPDENETSVASVFVHNRTKLYFLQVPDSIGTLQHVNEHYIGKLKLYQSGRACIATTDGKKFDIALGMQNGCREDIVTVDLDPRTHTGDMMNLGPAEVRLMLLPQLQKP